MGGALLFSALAHGGALTIATLYGNGASATNGGGVHEIEVAPAGPVPGVTARPAPPAHSHSHSHSYRLAATRVDEDEDAEESTRSDATAPAPTAPAPAAPSGGGGGILGEEEVDVPARLQATPNPVYPETARRDGVEGAVEVFLIVDTRGTVEHAEVSQPAGYGFDEAALTAARRFRFQPALKDGKPVRVHLHWICRFTIE